MKTQILGIIIGMLLIATVFSVAATQTTLNNETKVTTTDVDWWPMYQHDSERTGFSTSKSPDTNAILWNITIGSTVFYTSPVVSNGKVYIGSEDNNVYCFDAYTGQKIWNFTTIKQIRSTPAVVNGKVYVSCGSSAEFYCLDAAGNGDGTTTKIWSYTVGGLMYSSPTIFDNKVYFGCSDKYIFCLDAVGNGDGTTNLIWKYFTNKVLISSSPAVSQGRVFIEAEGTLFCLDAVGNGDGTTSELWIRNLFYSGGFASPLVANDKVYLGTSNGKIFCLNATDGQNIWNYSLQSTTNPSNLAFADDKIYVCHYLKNITYCLDAVGNGDGTTTKIWEYTLPETSGTVYSTPLVADGKVFFNSRTTTASSTYNNHVICLDAEGDSSTGTTTKIWQYSTISITISHGSPRTALALAEKSLFFASYVTQKLYCFQTNQAPDKPMTPNGPSEGIVGEPLTFSTQTNDPEDDPVYYQWKLGPYQTSWLGPYTSGAEASITHTFTQAGTYKVKVKATDNESESSWSDEATIVIKQTKLSVEISGGKGITVSIKNTGYAEAFNVSCAISITGGIILTPRSSSETFETIAVDETKTVTMPVFGFAFGLLLPLPEITINVTAPDVDAANETVEAKVFFSKVTIQ